MNTLTRSHWYREPWVWFNLVLLTAAIISASWMSILAVQHSPAEIGSRWYNDGALAKRERHQEVLISAIHLQGQLTVAADGSITFTMQHDTVADDQAINSEINPDNILLYIEHPTEPEQDQVIKLTRTQPLHYAGKLDHALSGKRRMLISPASDRWYLTAAGYFPVSQPLNFTPEMS